MRVHIDAVERAYLGAALGVGVLAWIALTLGELGRYSGPAVVAIGLPIGLIVVVGARRAGRAVPRPGREILGLLPALGLAAVMFAPPFEYVVGGLDPGIYVNTAAHLTRTGGIELVDREVAAMDPEGRRLLNDEPGIPGYCYGSRLIGFYFSDAASLAVEPHGLHLYPALLAVANSAGGLRAALWVNPLLALGGTVGLYLLGRRLFGPAVGAIGALLFVANPAVAWFARYTAAESLVLLLLVAGLLALAVALESEDRWLALAAGVSLGLVHIAKIEQVVLPFALAAFLGHRILVGRGGRVHAFLAGGYAVPLVHAIVHASVFAGCYSYSVLSRVARPETFGVAIAAVVLLALVLFLARRSVRARLEGPFAVRAVPMAAATLVVLLAVYASAYRPNWGGPPVLSLSPQDAVAEMARRSFIVLGWYVSPVALALGVIGYAAVVARGIRPTNAVLLVLVGVETVLYLYDAKINPVHFWSARRYIPVVFPAFALFTAVALAWVWRWRRGRSLGPAAAALFGLGVLVPSLWTAAPFVGHVEHAGAIAQVGAIAERVPVEAVVLFDDDDLGHRVSAPLQYHWGRASVILWRDALEDGSVPRLVDGWHTQGREVFWLTRRELPAAGALGRRVEPIALVAIDLPEAETTLDRPPAAILRYQVEARLYRIAR